MDIGTTTILRGIKSCKNTEDFERIFTKKNIINNMNSQWCKYYTGLKNGSGLNALGIEAITGVPRATLYRWNQRVPCKRRDYIVIGVVFNLGIKKTNKLLTRYGKTHKLKESDALDEKYIYFLENAEQYMGANDIKIHYEMIAAESDYYIGHNNQIAENLSDLLSEEFNYYGYKNKTDFLRNAPGGPLPAKFSNLLVNIFTPDIRYQFDDNLEIKIPVRNRLIALLLHIGLPIDEMNKVLECANMECLCARSPFEAALIFVLNQLFCEKPDLYSEQNRDLQNEMTEGSVFEYVHQRLCDNFFKDFLKNYNVDVKYELYL